MRITASIMSALAFLAGVGAHAAPACDRTCLETIADQYLTAMVAHDASKAPVASNIKYTENGVELGLVDGLWATASKIGSYKILVDDPTGGEVGYQGIIEEHGQPDIVALRLKVVGGKITEAEQIVSRGSKFADRLVTPRAVYSETVPPAERRSRDEMVKITNSYFDGIQANNGDMVPFDPSCNRIENGQQTTNVPGLAMLHIDSGIPGKPAPDYGAMGCRDQINADIYTFISKIDQRRVEVIDEEKGVTLMFAMFNHRGVPVTIKIPNVGEIPNPFAMRPSSVLISEMFKIKDGKIPAVEAVGTGLPYGAKTGWGPCSCKK